MIVKTIKSFLLIPLLLLFSYLNVSLYYQPDFQEENSVFYNKNVYNQLSFLKSELRAGAGHKMQQIFPEGFIFINVLYGLTWADLIQNLNASSFIYQEGITEIDWAFKEINSPNGKRIFSEKLPLQYGAFYRGWTNYLLAKKLQIQSSQETDSMEIKLFQENCREISEAIQKSPIPYLESYHQSAWPADIMPCVASLKIHDQIFEPKYDTLIQNWVASVKQNLDTETGLIPHSFNNKTGKTSQGARGCSQSLILTFLVEIDEEFSKEQFEIYKKLFTDTRFTLPGIREYPKGKEGKGDIDSGPVILDIGGAASIVGQRTMALHGDWTMYEGLRNCIESFGVGLTNSGKKKYIFGKLPMADAFIAWSNSVESNPNQMNVDSNWRWKFQALSLFICLIWGFFVKRL